MKILLAYKCHDLGKMEFYSRFTPLGLGFIGALLRRHGHDARIVNASAWSWRLTARVLEQERPDILGVSVFTFNRHEAMRLAALARAANPGALVIAGGPHATHLAHRLLEHYPQIDVVARGEGEETMLELVRAEERGDLEACLGTIRGITFRSSGLSRLRLTVAEYFERRGRLRRAREEYEALLSDNPRSLWARMRLGHLATRQGLGAEAEHHYRAAADITPAFRLARTLLARARRQARLASRSVLARRPAGAPEGVAPSHTGL